MAEQLYKYEVRAYSLMIPRRIYRLTVTAANADDARLMAAVRVGPDFGPTVESPKRRYAIETVEAEECFHLVVRDQETIDGILFGTCTDCYSNVCATGDEDDRGQPSWELTDREFVDFKGTKVEVAS